MDFWKGAFAPSMTKHVTSVTLIPLSQMSQGDWDVLDYDFLRPSARANLDQQILDGEVAGFYRVDVDMHKSHRPHGGKERYYYAATRTEVFGGEVKEPSDFQNYGNFDNAVDQLEVDTRPTDRLGYLLFMIKSLSPQAQIEVMEQINKELPADYEQIDTEKMSLLQLRDKALLVAIHLFLMNKPGRARSILKAVDILDDEVYALFNDDEPTE